MSTAPAMEVTLEAARPAIAPGQALFLVWSAPTHGSPRSRLLAAELNMSSPVYLHWNPGGGAITAPLRYAVQGLQTLRLLFQKRPRVVLVQSPPSFAVLFVALYGALTGSRYIIDAHSDAFQRGIWTRPAWLYERITRRALVTLVTDTYFARQIERKGGRAIVLRDPVSGEAVLPAVLPQEFSVTVVNTFARDEPLSEVLQAAAALPDVRFSITGKLERANPALLEQVPPNVRFTGYLPDEEYDHLLRSSHVVMSLTTRDHTLQCGACEALSRERPIVTSNWPLLRDYFNRGAVHVDNSPAGIAQGIEAVRREYKRYSAEVADLHAQRRDEWQQQIAALAEMINPQGE